MQFASWANWLLLVLGLETCQGVKSVGSDWVMGRPRKWGKAAATERATWTETYQRTKCFHQSSQMATTAIPSPQIHLPCARAEVLLTGDINQLPSWHQLSWCNLGQLPLTLLRSHSILKDSLKRTSPPRPVFLLKDAATAVQLFLPRLSTPS